MLSGFPVLIIIKVWLKLAASIDINIITQDIDKSLFNIYTDNNVESTEVQSDFENTA